jgi:pimeloyl-ACP methyl ester carboxylesterase
MKKAFWAWVFAVLGILAAGQAFGASSGVRPGVWRGGLVLRQPGSSGQKDSTLSATLRLKLFEDPTSGSQSGLIDIPELSMFGYPLDKISWTGKALNLVLDAPGTGQELDFEGALEGNTASSADHVVGTVKSASFEGTFDLAAVEEPIFPGEKELTVRSGTVALPGTLLVPVDRVGVMPLVLLLQGAGPADRNGNNYNVPGTCDSLEQLARALATKGIASFRFDKRGSGESYRLESPSMATSFSTFIDDVRAVIQTLGGLQGFSRFIVAGMNEGAWIGAAAIGDATNGAINSSAMTVDGLVAIDASGSSPMEQLDASLSSLDAATKKEAHTIIDAIMAGKSYQVPSATLADFFALKRNAWLASWLAFKPVDAFRAVGTAVLFVRGDSDLQVSTSDFEKLIDSRPQSPARSIRGMNYALKLVKSEEENYASFTDPKYPLPPVLVDLLAAFANVKPAPAGAAVYGRNIAK